MPTIRKSLRQAKPLTPQQRTKLAAIKDQDIDFSDNPELTATDIKRGLLKPMGRGGARPGSGRKSSGRQPVSLRLKPAVILNLRRQAKREGKTISQVAEERLLAS